MVTEEAGRVDMEVAMEVDTGAATTKDGEAAAGAVDGTHGRAAVDMVVTAEADGASLGTEAVTLLDILPGGSLPTAVAGATMAVVDTAAVDTEEDTAAVDTDMEVGGAVEDGGKPSVNSSQQSYPKSKKRSHF